MADDRYGPRRGGREQPRFSDERYRQRDRDEFGDRGRDDRGFFERAGDEIASWFGDDEDERRGRRDEQVSGRDPDQGRDSGRGYGRDRDPVRGSGQWRSDYDRGDHRGSGSSREREPWGGNDRSDRGYRPLAGDYGRSEGSSGSWGREDARRSRAAGPDRSQPHDRHYDQWRQRQIDELDRDYDEYRRENQSRFESEFGSWRSSRQTKRQMLGQVREQMEVIGSDDEPVGTVDRVAGERIILAKANPEPGAEAGGAHHSLSCSEIERVEGDRVILSTSAAEARNRWRDDSRERALFEREDQGQAGPHALDRSFPGTYR